MILLSDYISVSIIVPSGSTIPYRRYLHKGQEDHEEDLPRLEEDSPAELDSSVLRRRTMAAAAERRMQHQEEPAP